MVKTPKTAPKAESTAENTRRKFRLSPWLVGGAIAMVALAAWYGVAGYQTSDPAIVVLEQRIATLEQRIAALETDLGDSVTAGFKALGERVAAVESQSPVDLAPLDNRLSALEARPAATIASSVDTGPLEARLAALESAEDAPAAFDAVDDLVDRITALEARPVPQETASLPAATLLAVVQLRGALRGSGPYDTALAALDSLGDLDPAALAVLSTHAATGVVTHGALRDRFTSLADAILTAVVAPSEGSWIQRTLGRLSGLITVRRIGGDVTGNTVGAIVARAEARLGVGDLAAAVAEIAMLDGDVSGPWLADARARLAAEAALATLDAQAVAALAGR